MENVTTLKYFCELTGIDYEKLNALAEIPGCKLYHSEGDAFKHTQMVYTAMLSITENPILLKASILHDIGKIYTTRYNEERDTYEYPNHAKKGAENLKEFYSLWHEDFDTIQWLIENHIKPLFPNWQNRLTPIPPELDRYTALQMLAMLAWTDLQGSISEDSVYYQQRELKESLQKIFYTKDNHLLHKNA